MSKECKWTKDLQRHAHGGAFLQRISQSSDGQARQRHRVETELAAVKLALDQLASKHPEGFDAEHTLACLLYTSPSPRD